MKHITVSLAVFLLFLQIAKSQDSVKPKEVERPHGSYLIKLNLLEGQSFSAHLMDIKDSSVFVFQKKSAAPDPFHKGRILMNIDSNWDKYNYRFITSIKVRNKSLTTWTVLGGIVVGAIAGVAIANGSGSGSGINGEVNNTAAIALGLVLGGGVGALTGVIISSSLEKKYMINGDWKSFEEMKAALK